MKPHVHGCGEFVYKATTLTGKIIYIDPYKYEHGEWVYDAGINRMLHSYAEGKYIEHPCMKARKKKEPKW